MILKASLPLAHISSVLLLKEQMIISVKQGPRSKFSSGGAKEECVKENFFQAGGGGGMRVDLYSISLK